MMRGPPATLTERSDYPAAPDCLASRPMRVAYVRGTVLRPWDIPNYLPPGVDVEFVVSQATGRALADTGLPVRSLPSPGDVIAGLSPRLRIAAYMTMGSAEYLVGLRRAVAGADIVHTVEAYFPISLQALRAREAGACRAVVCSVMENIAFWPPQNPVVARRVARVVEGIDHFVAITERARLHLTTAGVPAERITVLPVGVDTQRFAPSPGWRRDDSSLRVLTISRLERGKGVEDLAIAAGLLAQTGEAIEVTYVGEGPSRAAIEAIARHYGISDRIRFAGGVPWERVHELHGDHDVFVLASAPTVNWREQFGYALVEAMSSGLPVLAGDSGSLMEIVGRPEALVTPHDPLSLAERLSGLAHDPGLRAELGAYNRDRVLERFDAHKVCAALGKLYERVLTER